jgi:hypothetical protein
MDIEIVRRPIGEAPEWVRDSWIGLRLPLAARGRRKFRGFGVLSGPTHLWQQLLMLATGRAERFDGYVVNAAHAVAILESYHPKAADWWYEHAPRMLDGWRNFVFDADCCEPRGD